MPPVRRTAAPTPPAVETVNFGSLSFYSGGFSLPKGRYAMEHTVMMFQPTKQDGSPVGKPRLGVMLTAHPLEGGGEPVEQFISMGSKADLSFAPDPATGKGVVPIPGGPASTLPRNTNWNLYLKSMYDCGLEEGVFTNDLAVLDGIWVQTDQVPEPEERKGYAKAATGEAEEERKGSGLIPVVSEILEGGKPWAGGGGFPEAVAAAPAKAPIGRIASKVATPKVAAPAPAAAAEATDDDVASAALSGITTVLEAEPNGTSKLKLRTGTFKAVTASSGAEAAQAVLDTYFGSDEALNSVLGQLGYAVNGGNVKPA